MTTTATYGAFVRLTWLPPDYTGAGTDAIYPWPLTAGIQLGEHACLSRGVSVPRYGRTWAGALEFYRQDEDGIPLAMSLGVDGAAAAPPVAAVAAVPATITLFLFDPVTQVKEVSIVVTPDAAVAYVFGNRATFTIPATVDPGRYSAALGITWPPVAPATVGESWIHCLGLVDVLPAYPVTT